MPDEMDYIYEVYKERSFSTAAKKLYVTQPALSSAIKKAEEKMGTLLFDRSSVPIRLTPAGKVYIEAIEQIRTIKEDMENTIRDVSRVKTGNIRVSGEKALEITEKIITACIEKNKGLTDDLTIVAAKILANL